MTAALRLVIVCTDQHWDLEFKEHELTKRQRRQLLEKQGARVIVCNSTSDNRVDLRDMLQKLGHLFESIMVEGGASIITALLQETFTVHPAAPPSGWCPLVSQVVLTIAPVLIGGMRSVQCLLPCTSDANGAQVFPRFVNPTYFRLGDDMIFAAAVC